jgi:hypothetical protein
MPVEQGSVTVQCSSNLSQELVAGEIDIRDSSAENSPFNAAAMATAASTQFPP